MSFEKIISQDQLLDAERLELHKVLFLLLLNRKEALNEVTTLDEVAEINLMIVDFKNQLKVINKYLNTAQRRINSVENVLRGEKC